MSATAKVLGIEFGDIEFAEKIRAVSEGFPDLPPMPTRVDCEWLKPEIEAIVQYARDCVKANDDAKRLDWLDKQCKPVIEGGGTQHDPDGEHVANAWAVECPAGDVRTAIDMHIFADARRKPQ